MTIIGDERDELDPVQELLSIVESLDTRVPKVSSEEFVQQYKKKILAKHRERIRDGFVGEDERYLSKRSKLNPVEKVDQLIRYNPLIFKKMVEAQEEALEKLYEHGIMPDAPYENFCGNYGALQISP